MPPFRNSPSQVIYSRIRITICDPINGYIEGRDVYNQPVRLAYSFYYSPYVQVPRVGEDWIVKKIDNNWTLYARFDSEDQTTPVTKLFPGDVRIESKNILRISADEEILIDFNKAKESLAELNENTLPGSALYGSGTLNQFSAGTLITTDKFITPLRTSLSTANVADGQQEHLLADDSHGIIWSFRYRSNSASSYKWESIGASTHTNFSTASFVLSSPSSTAWYGNGTPEHIYIPYTGEYLISTGVQVLSSSPNSPYKFGVTTGGTAGSPVVQFTGFCNTSNDSTTTTSSYFGTFNAGSYINQVYQSPAGHNLTISQRWFSVQPIRVTT